MTAFADGSPYRATETPGTDVNRSRLSAKRAAWVEAAPIPDEARKVLLILASKASRSSSHVVEIGISYLSERIGLTPLETKNCIRYLHDICLVTIDWQWSIRVKFGAVATPRVRLRPTGPAWQKIRKAVIDRDGLYCRYCWKPCAIVEIDHIHPLSRGGSNDLRNLCVSCRDCNGMKGAKTWFEWRFPLGGDAA